LETSKGLKKHGKWRWCEALYSVTGRGGGRGKSPDQKATKFGGEGKGLRAGNISLPGQVKGGVLSLASKGTSAHRGGDTTCSFQDWGGRRERGGRCRREFSFATRRNGGKELPNYANVLGLKTSRKMKKGPRMGSKSPGKEMGGYTADVR